MFRPLDNEVVLEREVEICCAHIRREVQQKDNVVNDRTAYRRGRREESEKVYEKSASAGMGVSNN